MPVRDEKIYDALQLWAPDYPRRVTRNQVWEHNYRNTVRRLLDAEDDPDDQPFISVYSFPRGHTKEDNVPEINTLFIDFDFDEGEYVRGSGDREAWQRDMSHLLVRARKVASVIREGGRAAGWRASLSGHKGIHLFLDFPALSPSLGDFNQYVTGLNEYATDLVRELSDKTGLHDLDEYVDVTSSDLGRLCRVPNTLHGGASESFDEKRYCVPVTIDELAELSPEEYEQLTRRRRTVPWSRRRPVENVGEIIGQYVQTASESTYSYGRSSGGSTVDWNRVETYKNEANDDLTLDDVYLLTSDMPCVWEFHKREDKFQYGNESHILEIHSIAKLVESNFPIDVIKSFLSNAPEYDEEYTERLIEELIARDFNPYSTEKLLRQAPEFMNSDGCMNCQQTIANSEELQRMYRDGTAEVY